MSNFYTSAEAMDLEEFAEAMAEAGWIARKPTDGETASPADMVFEDGDGSFVAWEEGDHIGAKRYPEELQDVVCLYEEGTEGYDLVNGG